MPVCTSVSGIWKAGAVEKREALDSRTVKWDLKLDIMFDLGGDED